MTHETNCHYITDEENKRMTIVHIGTNRNEMKISGCLMTAGHPRVQAFSALDMHSLGFKLLCFFRFICTTQLKTTRKGSSLMRRDSSNQYRSGFLRLMESIYYRLALPHSSLPVPYPSSFLRYSVNHLLIQFVPLPITLWRYFRLFNCTAYRVSWLLLLLC